jgi:Ser/Thr protein kinase RdoA (MazF antagonist)
MPLYNTITVDENEVRRLISEHWNINLGKCLKSAQNHTYIATAETNSKVNESDLQKFIVRVTPDPDQSRVGPTNLELDLLQYLEDHNLPVCVAVPRNSSTKELILVENQNIIVVFKHARGEPVDFVAFKWMLEKERVVGVGRWMGKLHNLTRQYVQERPELVSHARHWTQLHDGVLKDVSVHPDDRGRESDPLAFSLIHGDVNPSNYFWIPERGLPDMFDWDQLQRSWLMYDLSQPIFGVEMLAGAGNPFTGGECPEANPNQFREWIVEGYEAEGHKVDKQHLDRMILIRIELYRLFCSKGLAEVAPDSGLAKFFEFIMKWLNAKHPNPPKYE